MRQSPTGTPRRVRTGALQVRFKEGALILEILGGEDSVPGRTHAKTVRGRRDTDHAMCVLTIPEVAQFTVTRSSPHVGLHVNTGPVGFRIAEGEKRFQKDIDKAVPLSSKYLVSRADLESAIRALILRP